MTYYDSFNSKIQCEEFYTVNESELLDAPDYLGYEEYLDSLEPTEREAFLEQKAFDEEQEKLKANFNFNPPDEDDSYEGVAI